VRDTVSCQLLQRDVTDKCDMKPEESCKSKLEVESDPAWQCDRNTYFADLNSYPCRDDFRMWPLPVWDVRWEDNTSTANVTRYDYGLVRQDGHLVPRDKRVHTMQRRGQLCSQIHKCTFTCFKYNRDPYDRACRFDAHLWSSSLHMHEEVTIVRDRDRRSRVRVRALPSRNNHHVNNNFVCPSIPLALSSGNVDIKILPDTQHGAAEYVCRCAYFLNMMYADVLQ